MTQVAMTQEKQASLDVRLHAQMFLAESGWRTHTQWQKDGDRIWEVFFAVHDKWPEQRALSVTELVKRCTWQETHRTHAIAPNDRQ